MAPDCAGRAVHPSRRPTACQDSDTKGASFRAKRHVHEHCSAHSSQPKRRSLRFDPGTPQPESRSAAHAAAGGACHYPIRLPSLGHALVHLSAIWNTAAFVCHSDSGYSSSPHTGSNLNRRYTGTHASLPCRGVSESLPVRQLPVRERALAWRLVRAPALGRVLSATRAEAPFTWTQAGSPLAG